MSKPCGIIRSFAYRGYEYYVTSGLYYYQYSIETGKTKRISKKYYNKINNENTEARLYEKLCICEQ